MRNKGAQKNMKIIIFPLLIFKESIINNNNSHNRYNCNNKIKVIKKEITLFVSRERKQKQTIKVKLKIALLKYLQQEE